MPRDFGSRHCSSHGEVLHASFPQGVQHLLPLVFSRRTFTILFCRRLPLFSQSDRSKNKRSRVRTYRSGILRSTRRRPHLCRKLSFAISMRRVPPFHLDLFNTETPAATTHTTRLTSLSATTTARCHHGRAGLMWTRHAGFPYISLGWRLRC